MTLGTSKKICRENPNFVEIGQIYRVIYMKNNAYFTFAGDIKSP